MTNGPVEVLFFVYDDLYTYHTGVYKHKKGKLAGGHAVKLLGIIIDHIYIFLIIL